MRTKAFMQSLTAVAGAKENPRSSRRSLASQRFLCQIACCKSPTGQQQPGSQDDRFLGRVSPDREHVEETGRGLPIL